MRIAVSLGEGRSYEVHVVAGGLGGLGAAVAEVHPPGPLVLAGPSPVVRLHGDVARESLVAAGFQVTALGVPDGERHKTLDSWRLLVDELIALGVDRRTPVVALGGGVTGDLVGFAAATVKRGVPVVQVPTTLLAMVDSAVGGKTGVNTPAGKNLVGAFHQPSLVYAATDTLRTLAGAEVRCGLGEVVKHGLIRDRSLFELCREEARGILDLDAELLQHLVVRSCEIKAAVVAQDERERGLRAILNCGHTVGHAIETTLRHGTLRHGECVAIGLLAEARWAVARGDCAADVPAKILATLDALGLPWSPPRLDRDLLQDALRRDKKWARGTLSTAVLLDIGAVRLDRIDRAEARQMMDELPLPNSPPPEPPHLQEP